MSHESKNRNLLYDKNKYLKITWQKFIIQKNKYLILSFYFLFFLNFDIEFSKRSQIFKFKLLEDIHCLKNQWERISGERYDRILIPFQRLVLLSNFSWISISSFPNNSIFNIHFLAEWNAREQKFFLSGGKQIAARENVIRVKKFRYTSIPLLIIAIGVLQWTHCFNASVKCLLVKFVTTR